MTRSTLPAALLTGSFLVVASQAEAFQVLAPLSTSQQVKASFSSADGEESSRKALRYFAGQVSFLSLEGGMFEFRDEHGDLYDLHEFPSMEPSLAKFLRARPGQPFDVLVFGNVSPHQMDIHMRGTVVDVQRVFVISPVATEAKLTDQLRERMSEVTNELIPVKIIMRDQLNAEVLQAIAGNLPQPEARKTIIGELKELAETTQEEVREYLEAQSRRQNRVTRTKYLWLTNAISALVSKDVLAELARMPRVARIDLDEERPALIP